jgi:peptidoglycan/LPS O-acetylase OafA/YrhL
MIAIRSPYANSGLGVLCALMILVIVAPLARGQDSAIARWLDLPPVLYVGKVSLSAYLWHFPVMLLLGRSGVLAGDTLAGMLYNVVIVIAATILISTVTYYSVEKPVMNVARRYRHRWA